MNRFESFTKIFRNITTANLVVIIIFLGFMLYGRMLMNGFVGDDLGYIQHPYIKNFQIWTFFQSGSADLGGASPITGQFFRPMMLVALSLIDKTFGDMAFFYHFFQLIFHIGNVILVFFLFKKIFSQWAAFILSLIFLIHPINVETVAYISDLQDIFFVFFGLTALNILTRFNFKDRIIWFVPILLLLSLLSKETGILFIFVSLFYVFIFNKGEFKKLSLLLMSPIAIYAFLRFVVASVGFGKVPHSMLSDLTILERLFYIPKIIIYYIQTLIFPKDLALAQTWTIAPGLQTFNIPLVLIFVICLSIGYLGWKIKMQNINNFRIFLLFLVWLALGLLFHLQIFPLEMTVADRWFYFPFIGLLGMVGVILNLLKRRDLQILLIVALILLPVFFVRSFIRIGDYKNSLTLYGHDTKVTKSYLLEHSFGYELMQQKNMPEAYVHLNNAVQIYETPSNTNSLGVYFFKKSNTKDAIKWFTRSTELGDSYLAYNNLSRILLTENKIEKALPVIERATEEFPKSDSFWFLFAIANYKKGNSDAALIAAEKAFSISQSQQNYYVVMQLRQGLPIVINN